MLVSLIEQTVPEKKYVFSLFSEYKYAHFLKKTIIYIISEMGCDIDVVQTLQRT